MIGKTLSHYKITEQLGKGGMGEVYLADDTTLDRKVALKFLPEVFTNDPERMARFEREAKLLASLNHPNIAGIYGLEQADGNRFLVLEYVEGETLQAKLKKEALPLDEALAVCRQIAEGLEAAHEKGVIHRDLKPSNVMITAEEKVKILDFGLAKALADETQGVDPSDSPTITAAMTQPGVVLGTAAYMSPEQAKGKSVDKRADIWAFGCILFECLTGKRTFEGETVTETLAAILRGEPDWNVLPIAVPQNIRFVLRRCLEKDKNRRFRDAADVQIEIEETREVDESIITAEQRRSWQWKIVAAVFIIAFLFVSFIHFRDKPADTSGRVIFQDRLPENVRLGGMGLFALSPDGRHLVFSGISSDGIQQLYLRSLDSLEVRPLIGTKNYKLVMDFFWSPDSRYIAFIADEGKLRKIDIISGSVTTICELPSEFYSGRGSWNTQGEILLSDYPPDTCIVRVSASGGSVTPVTKPNKERQELRHSDPVFLPDDRHFLYLCESTLEEYSGVLLGSLDYKPEEQSTERLLASTASVLYMPSRENEPGQILYREGQILMTQPFDEKRLELTGDPLHVVDPVGNIWFYGFYSVSTNCVLIYRPPNQSQIVWVNRERLELNEIGIPGDYPTFDLSRNGERLVISEVEASGYQNLWVMELARSQKIPLTQADKLHVDPRWASDQRHVIFGSRELASNVLMQVSYPPANPAQFHQFEGPNYYLDDISPDGDYFLYHINGKPEIWAHPANGDEDPILAASSLSGQIDQSQFSPDGRWIAYNTNVSGRWEVVVVPFPPTEGGGKWAVSTEGGMQPTWRGDGRELYFLTEDGWLMAVDIHADETFEHGDPQRLFKTKVSPNYGMEQYAPHPSGEKFLLVRPTIDSATAPFTVILNWTALLEQ